MLLHYRPADGDPETFVFDQAKIGNGEAELIEKRTDWTWTEFMQKLQQGSTLARRALLWTFLRRVHATLRFEDVRFSQGEVELQFQRDELEDIRAQVAKAPNVAGVDKDALLAQLDVEIAEAPPSGKALASSAD
jgi:hypothetical protein